MSPKKKESCKLIYGDGNIHGCLGQNGMVNDCKEAWVIFWSMVGFALYFDYGVYMDTTWVQFIVSAIYSIKLTQKENK